jgi:hypothetical protein
MAITCVHSGCLKRKNGARAILEGGRYCAVHTCRSRGCKLKIQLKNHCRTHISRKDSCISPRCSRKTRYDGKCYEHASLEAAQILLDIYNFKK